MAVTKATYTATATWTASGLANIFRDAFIAAGLMTDWYDNFLNTVENRILEVTYDGAKTYGKVYYWFMFTTSGVFVHTALGWNATTHVPTGTQYLDYFATTTNATTNHRQLITLSAATTVTLTRYTSAVDTDCSWFLIRNGTTNQAFMISSPGFGPSSFIDLSKLAYNHILTTLTAFSGSHSNISFLHASCHTRRTFLGAAAMRSATTNTDYQIAPYLHRFCAIGNTTTPTNNITSSAATTGIWLPYAASNVNTSLASDHTPVLTGPTVSPYMAALPGDFGVVGYWPSDAMTVQDTLVVSSGTEEWEMLAVANNTTASSGHAMFLARTV